MARSTKKAPGAARTAAAKKAAPRKAAAPKAAAGAAVAGATKGTILKVPGAAPARKAPATPYRERLLDYLVKGGAVAEIGVWKGDFSAVLIEKLQPSALHLIDPWLFQPQYPTRM